MSQSCSWRASTTSAQLPHQQQRQHQSKSRRMASLTQSLRGNQPMDPSPPEQARPRTFYVPTHAAASFAKTASPPLRTRINEKGPKLPHGGSASPRLSIGSSRHMPSCMGRNNQISHQGDFTTYLAEAAANEHTYGSPRGSLAHDVNSKTNRDSAYYSNESRSSFSSGMHGARNSSMLAKKPSKTLGRRLSEYFKPPMDGRNVA